MGGRQRIPASQTPESQSWRPCTENAKFVSGTRSLNVPTPAQHSTRMGATGQQLPALHQGTPESATNIVVLAAHSRRVRAA